jgi:predicted DNA binding CopG/RHH family protein
MTKENNFGLIKGVISSAHLYLFDNDRWHKEIRDMVEEHWDFFVRRGAKSKTSLYIRIELEQIERIKQLDKAVFGADASE